VPSNKRARQKAGRAARVAQLQAAQKRRRRNTRTIPFIVVVVAVVVALILVTGPFSSSSKKTATTTTTVKKAAPTTAVTTAAPCPSFGGTSARRITFTAPQQTCITPGHTYTETMVMNVGTVTVQFDTTKTPDTANNFIVLSLYHYFDGTKLFRTDTSIGIIQGGSPHTEDNSDPGPGYTIKDEGSGFTYQPGDLVMARTSAANSGSAQFFFCVTSACSNLNAQGTYVVFAHVTSGLSVLQSILSSSVGSGSLGGAPAKTTTIEKTTVTQA
jgi:cyclophilin family peptidyl-prolyl cis-trans isomerase